VAVTVFEFDWVTHPCRIYQAFGVLEIMTGLQGCHHHQSRRSRSLRGFGPSSSPVVSALEIAGLCLKPPSSSSNGFTGGHEKTLKRYLAGHEPAHSPRLINRFSIPNTELRKQDGFFSAANPRLVLPRRVFSRNCLAPPAGIVADG
jgi:hypothetical protein